MFIIIVCIKIVVIKINKYLDKIKIKSIIINNKANKEKENKHHEKEYLRNY